MAEKPAKPAIPYTPTPEELQVIALVTTRFTESKDHFLDNSRSKFDQFYKDYREYAGDRQALLDTANKSWASNTFVPLTSSYIR